MPKTLYFLVTCFFRQFEILSCLKKKKRHNLEIITKTFVTLSLTHLQHILDLCNCEMRVLVNIFMVQSEYTFFFNHKKEKYLCFNFIYRIMDTTILPIAIAAIVYVQSLDFLN